MIDSSLNHPLRSVHTASFPALLQQLGISLLVSTYQAGKLIVLRAEGEVLNTHFRPFNKPMGLAIRPGRIALGTATQIWEFGNVPTAVAKLDSADRHDACYLPRHIHQSGDIDIHELAYAGDELWAVNTRFSCLCTFDRTHSFVPRWRPPFVSAYAVTDRCHLNGLGLRDQRPRYITALGATDTAGGWRDGKAKGGLLMDIETNERLCQGLSMPHSPRWHRDQLWVLESGQGSLVKVDFDSGRWETVVQLPGFTRGLDFGGDWAFVGLSQVRESATFSGLPLTERLAERTCGVWAIHLLTGQVGGFVRFEAGVQEIFAVQVLPGTRFPELIAGDEKLLGSTYVLPEAALKELAPVPVPDPAPTPPVLNSLSIIVPVYNIERKGTAVLQSTLASIEASLDYLDAEVENRFAAEIVLIDDGSKDNTWKILERLTHGRPRYRRTRHRHNRGPGAARNTGARVARGQVLCFCDDDDRYRPDHLLTALTALAQPLTPGTASPLWSLPGNYPAAVKTGVEFPEPLHPYWEQQIAQVLPLNLVVRREVHDLIEGFPEDEAFRTSAYGMEDCAYAQWLTAGFSVIWLPVKTVEHRHTPGNHFDRQRQRFRSAPGDYQEPVSPQERQTLAQIDQIIQQQWQALQEKLRTLPLAGQWLSEGNESYRRQQLSEASRCYRHCLALRPDILEARYNLGVVYLEQEEFDAATTVLEQVLLANPDCAEAHNNLGIIRHRQQQLPEAIASFRRAIALRSDFPDAHMNLGMTLLEAGQLSEGWAEYEWRWQTRQFAPLQCARPLWDGRDISEQTLLVHTEQGAGDAIQFARYLPLVKRRCRRLLLCCPDSLAPLLATAAGVDQVYGAGEIPVTAFDTYVPLLSLPQRLGTTRRTIPVTVPYLGQDLRPEDFPFLAPLPGQVKVGLVWAGIPTHHNDQHRSCPLLALLPLLQVSHCTIYSLQKGPRVEELAQLPSGAPVIDLSAYLKDFAATARVVVHLDLVISVDTAVLHLAGALGKSVWGLLGEAPDWRWGLGLTDSPWYPTLRLFRQRQPGNWAEVGERVARALQVYLSQRNGAALSPSKAAS